MPLPAPSSLPPEAPVPRREGPRAVFRRPPVRPLLGMLGLVSLLLGSPLPLGCDGSNFDAAAATDVARPHLSEFASFDAWARRALVADPAIRNQAALEEALFAPIRREEAVLGAWVGGDGGASPIAFGHLRTPPELTYRMVRDGTLGEVYVATEKIPDPRASFDEDGPRLRAVVLRRTQETDDGAPVTVTVAYRAVH